jgi:hypothetical protein
MRLVATTISALALTASPAVAASVPYNPRPHSDLALRGSGLRVARFEAGARPHGKRIRVIAVLTARSRKHDVRAILRIGRCTGGPIYFPLCQPNVSRRVTLHATKTTFMRLIADVPRPSHRVDAIRVSVTPPGKVVRPYGASAAAGMADLLLPARAWTAYPDRTFGLRLYQPWEADHEIAYDVRSLRAHGAQVASDALRPTLAWKVSASRTTQIQTVVSACAGTLQCQPLTTEKTIPAGGTRRYLDRPLIKRNGRPAIWSFFTRSGDGVVFNVTLPWPRVE